ncbi:hypothetical protein KIPB_013613, partial [Kipferlia bialata]
YTMDEAREAGRIGSHMTRSPPLMRPLPPPITPGGGPGPASTRATLALTLPLSGFDTSPNPGMLSERVPSASRSHRFRQVGEREREREQRSGVGSPYRQRTPVRVTNPPAIQRQRERIREREREERMVQSARGGMNRHNSRTGFDYSPLSARQTVRDRPGVTYESPRETRGSTLNRVERQRALSRERSRAEADGTHHSKAAVLLMRPVSGHVHNGTPTQVTGRTGDRTSTLDMSNRGRRERERESKGKHTKPIVRSPFQSQALSAEWDRPSTRQRRWGW